jgi:drug/metabolite transporter (DMT)-like permease
MPPRLQAFLAVVLWGISFVATKAALREISPVALIFARSALGAALLIATLAARRQPLAPPRDAWGPLALMGFVGVAFHQVLQAYGIRLTTAVHAGWIIGLIPIWSAVLAALFLRERFGAGKLAGLLLGFAGAALVVSRGHAGAGMFALPGTRGDLLMLASTLNWAIYTTLGHDTIRRIGSLRATAGAMGIGGLMLVPLFLSAGGWREYAALSPAGLLAVLYLGLGSSGLGYLFWCGALERVETSRVAAFLYLEPLVTLVAAMALLHEPLAPTTLAGGLTVLAGVALVQRAPARKAAT